MNPHETTTFHTVCKFGLALAHYIILTKNYPANERSLKAKFTVWALSFGHFSLSFRLGTKATKSCRHFVDLLRCTADQQNTVSRPKNRIFPVSPRAAHGHFVCACAKGIEFYEFGAICYFKRAASGFLNGRSTLWKRSCQER